MWLSMLPKSTIGRCQWARKVSNGRKRNWSRTFCCNCVYFGASRYHKLGLVSERGKIRAGIFLRLCWTVGLELYCLENHSNISKTYWRAAGGELGQKGRLWESKVTLRHFTKPGENRSLTIFIKPKPEYDCVNHQEVCTELLEIMVFGSIVTNWQRRRPRVVGPRDANIPCGVQHKLDHWDRLWDHLGRDQGWESVCWEVLGIPLLENSPGLCPGRVRSSEMCFWH